MSATAPSEAVQAKAVHLLAAGRVGIQRCSEESEEVLARVLGDSETDYVVTFAPDPSLMGAPLVWACSCPAHGVCSHIVAVNLVVRRTT